MLAQHLTDRNWQANNSSFTTQPALRKPRKRQCGYTKTIICSCKSTTILIVTIICILYQVGICHIQKRSEEVQTLHAGCSKAEPKNFASLQTPFPGARDGQNLISWRSSLPLPTNLVWWWSMRAIFRVIVVTDPPTQPPTQKQTGAITIHCAADSTQCNNEHTQTECKPICS